MFYSTRCLILSHSVSCYKHYKILHTSHRIKYSQRRVIFFSRLWYKICAHKINMKPKQEILASLPRILKEHNIKLFTCLNNKHNVTICVSSILFPFLFIESICIHVPFIIWNSLRRWIFAYKLKHLNTVFVFEIKTV